MSSKGGPRAAGTDGSDYGHRELVASHYKMSVTYKFRLKSCIVLHGVLFVLMLVRMLPLAMRALHLRMPLFMKQAQLPRVLLWEQLWLLSLTASIFGWVSMSRNKKLLLIQYIIGLAVFGLGPLAFGAYDKLDELRDYVSKPELVTVRPVLGLPFVCVWYIFFAVAAQLHSFGIYFAYRLYRTWVPGPKPKRT